MGDRGNGTFNHNHGTHSAEELIIGSRSGGNGLYNLGNSAILQTVSTAVGADGLGDFVQGSGLHTTENLRVGSSSSYKLNGGSLQATNMVVEGFIEIAGGTLEASVNKSLIVTGGIHFGTTQANLAVGGIADLSQATTSTSGGGGFSVTSTGLLTVSPQTKFLIDTGTITATSSGQPIHVAGNTLTIDQHTVTGAGKIDDYVVVAAAGSVSPALIAEGGNINLDSGIAKTFNSVVDLGSTGGLRVSDGRDGVGSSSVIQSSAGNFTSGLVLVGASGHLNIEGEAETTIANYGTIEIGNVNGSLFLGANAGLAS